MKKLILALVIVMASWQLDAQECKVGFVNLKVSIEKSKHGQREKAAFDTLKKQLNDKLEKSDKEIGELAKKLEDQNHMESLSPEAANELKQKVQKLSQDFVRTQNQYYQMLNQANIKMLQQLQTTVCKAAEKIRERKKLDFILSEDSAFAFAPSLDLSDDIVKEMDARFDEENQP